MQILGKEGISSLIFFICAIILTPYNFGVFNYILSVISLLLIFCDFGISGSVTKFTAEYNVTDKNKINILIFNSMTAILFLSILVSILTIIFGKFYLKENYNLTVAALPMLLFIPLTSMFDGVFRGLKKFKELTIISLITGAISVFIVFILIKYFDLTGAVISKNIYYLITFISMFLAIRSIKLIIDWTMILKIIKYSLVLGITGLMFFLYTKVDVLILKHFGYIIEIGYYEIIIKIIELIILPFIIFGQVIAPNITEIYVKKQFEKIKKKISKHILLSTVVSVIFAIILYFILPFILKFIFPKYYNDSLLSIMYLLLIISPIRMIGQIVNNGYTISTGNAHLNMITMIPAGIMNIILDVIFIKYFGFIGVVYSTMICFSFGSISLIILFYFKLNRLILINKDSKL